MTVKGLPEPGFGSAQPSAEPLELLGVLQPDSDAPTEDHVAIIAFEIRAIRGFTIRDLETQAINIAENGTAVLTMAALGGFDFQDLVEKAETELDATSRPEILRSYYFDRARQLFASYRREGVSRLTDDEVEKISRMPVGYHPEESQFRFVKKVNGPDDEFLGIVHVVSDKSVLYRISEIPSAPTLLSLPPAH